MNLLIENWLYIGYCKHSVSYFFLQSASNYLAADKIEKLIEIL